MYTKGYFFNSKTDIIIIMFLRDANKLFKNHIDSYVHINERKRAPLRNTV